MPECMVSAHHPNGQVPLGHMGADAEFGKPLDATSPFEKGG
jgi:hypothetical protein